MHHEKIWMQQKHACCYAPLVPRILDIRNLFSSNRFRRFAINQNGETLLAWTEGTAWKRGGSIHWQVFDASLKPQAQGAGAQRGLVAWSLPTAVATRDGSFVVVY